MLHLFQTPRTIAVLPSIIFDMVCHSIRKSEFRNGFWLAEQRISVEGESIPGRDSPGQARSRRTHPLAIRFAADCLSSSAGRFEPKLVERAPRVGGAPRRLYVVAGSHDPQPKSAPHHCLRPAIHDFTRILRFAGLLRWKALRVGFMS